MKIKDIFRSVAMEQEWEEPQSIFPGQIILIETEFPNQLKIDIVQ